MHFGRLIASWDKPEFVPAGKAIDMRDEDYVVGLVYRGIARAYPLWVTDNYHVINDRIAGDPIIFTTCERCQSGSAFVSLLEGEPVNFSGIGMFNAALMLTNRASEVDPKASLWLHYEGVGIWGKFAGMFLPQVPTFHTIWKDWRLAHPDTDVMIAPSSKYHRDARHGHGREEYFARPGMELPMVQTITGKLDDRYPENEMVLGINLDQGLKAYPLREVKKSGGVVLDHLGDHPIVILAGPRPEQFTMAAYSRLLDDYVLTFYLDGDHFVDNETHTLWDIEGVATRGPLAKRHLSPLRCQYVRWHSWFYPHQSTALYRHETKLPIYPEVISNLDISSFQPVLESLSKLDRQIVIEGAIINLRLPHEALKGVVLWVGTDRLNLFLFSSEEAAEDFVTLHGAWFCMPINTKVDRKVSRRSGKFVLVSDPEIQYTDPTQIIRLPDAQIKWSDLVTDESLVVIWSLGTTDSVALGEPTYTGLFRHLKRAGYDVIETSFLPHSQLRIGAINAVAATISADRFVIYKCADIASGERVALEVPHAMRIGRWVLRSIPVDMYEDQIYEIRQLTDEQIRWSKLIANQRFHTTLQSYFRNHDAT